MTIFAATMLIFSSCYTGPVAKREIYAALCVPSNSEDLMNRLETEIFLPFSDWANIIGENQLTWIISTLLVDDPLLSGKYEWNLPDDDSPGVLACNLAAYWAENGSLISEQDTEIAIYERDKSSGVIFGVLHISTSYGLSARVYFEAELKGKDVFIREARVPLAGSSDSKSGLVIISNGLLADRFQIGVDGE